MSKTVIKIENLSKLYMLGQVGTGTVSHDLNRWWAQVWGKEDPYAKVGHVNDRTQKAEKGEKIWALKDINLEVKEGEVLGIIGKNGAGKSTLLKILSRITSPTTGSYKIKGRMASLLEVGTGFHPELTGRENIYMNGTIMGMRKWEIDRKLDEIVEFAGVAKYIDTPTKRYSSGMTVRLGFAIAAHLDPEILVVDEVLAVGDAEFQKKAIGKMQEVSQGQGRTVLFVSHNMNSINMLCKTGIIMKNGSVDFAGEIRDVTSRYMSIFNDSSLIPSVKYDRSEKHIQILSGELIDKNGELFNRVIDVNEPIRLHIVYKTERHYNKMHFTYIIKNSFSENVLFVDRTDFHKEFVALEKGVYSACLSIPNPMLVPGKYYLTLGFADNEEGINDHKYDVMSFEIANLSTFRSLKRNSYTFIPTQWELSKIE